MTSQVIAQGAEATITLEENTETSSEKPFVIKNRTPKSYRLPELDQKIRRQRTKSEAKLLTKASQIIPVPKPFHETKFSNTIKMPFIPGLRLSEHLDTLNNKNEIAQTIGAQIAKLHNADIIHGDLTTSNMILSESGPQAATQTTASSQELSPKKLFFIDFGLSFIHKHAEHKAVDLHLIKQALKAKHTKNAETLFQEIQKAYTKESNNAEDILKRLEQVEKRGRYKQAY